MPFAIEFLHALTKHSFDKNDISKLIEINKPEYNCAVFHFPVNQNTINFSSEFISLPIEKIQEKIGFIETFNTSNKPYSKTSRAPPILLFMNC